MPHHTMWNFSILKYDQTILPSNSVQTIQDLELPAFLLGIDGDTTHHRQEALIPSHY